MKDFEKLLISNKADVHAAIEKLDNNDAHIVLVVDQNRNLLGTITDGDVRRGILRAVKLSDPVIKIMNANPLIARLGQNNTLVYADARKKKIRQIPVLNKQGKIEAIEILDDLHYFHKKENVVVLMAGGMSTRLRPLTNDCPKPMLKVGGKPILETIIMSLKYYGFHEFHISINYLADQIKRHFKDGTDFGISIHYLTENDKLGTAGPLSLLPRQDLPIIVMNSDILTKVDFNQLLTFHHEQGVSATMCVREFDYTIPYGICKLKNNLISEVKEKPTYKFFINAGVYVLEPKILSFIPPNAYFDMPALFSLIAKKEKAAAFPIREYWLDIGQLSDFERAHQDYNHVFESM